MSTIDLPTLQSIRRLLRASVRHAEIARRFNLAVGTISRIASVRRLRRLKLHLLSEDELPEDDPPPDYRAARLRRCPGCGGMVYQWPCLTCRLRAAEESDVALVDGQEVEPCAPKGQPAPAQAAGLGSQSAHDCSAPTGRAELGRLRAGQRAPLGLTAASSMEMELNHPAFPGLRPGLSQVGPLGRNAPPLVTSHSTD
jgi:hypothetical protein